MDIIILYVHYNEHSDINFYFSAFRTARDWTLISLLNLCIMSVSSKNLRRKKITELRQFVETQ